MFSAADTAALALTEENRVTVIAIGVIAVVALLVALVLVREVLSAGQGSAKMREISAAVQEGAAAYLNRQFKTLVVFGILASILLWVLPANTTNERVGRAIFFVVGALFSGLTGYLGMWLAVRANTRVAAAAQTSGEIPAMRIAFRSGGVAGMVTVGLGLLGAAIVVLVYAGEAPRVLEGFGFGAALLAMFMRVGGGIFTKAADVGADLVGKVEQGIPEDDPRNAATIADNVGDNVGDCAGMAADLFESYAVTLVAALILGSAALGSLGLVFPLVIPAIGVLTSILGIFLANMRKSDKSAMSAINRGFFVSAIASAILVSIAAFWFLPDRLDGLSEFAQIADRIGLDPAEAASFNPRVLAIGAVLIGIALAALIQLLTGYFTETNRKPVDTVAQTSLTGPATVILSGISVGLESAVYSALLIAAAVFGAASLGGGSFTLALFAVGLAGTGLLTTVGVTVAMDTFGPISDNAQGIAEMAGDPVQHWLELRNPHPEGSAALGRLDAVGNTTKAITKGIAIATAVLAATALFGAFADTIIASAAKAGEVLDLGMQLNISEPVNLVGLIIGAAVVFLFSGLAINAVGRAAGAVVFEVRKQFRERPGIMAGTERPEYGKVVDICTRDSLRELVTPGLLAVMAPIAVGFGLGVGALGSFLAGAIAAGVLMAVFLANSGGAWDNAKKYVEEGNHGGKGSPAHEATIIGDTVGDPFKDTAGPSINPLLKVMNLVALLVAPAAVQYSMGPDSNVVLRVVVSLIAVAVIVAAVWFSKRRSVAIAESD